MSELIKVGDDWSHRERMQQLLKDMKRTCAVKNIDYPLASITTENIDVALTPQLEDMVVMAALPGAEVEIAHGMEAGKFQKHIKRKKGVETTLYMFPSRLETVLTCLEILERSLANMEGRGGGHA